MLPCCAREREQCADHPNRDQCPIWGSTPGNCPEGCFKFKFKLSRSDQEQSGAYAGYEKPSEHEASVQHPENEAGQDRNDQGQRGGPDNRGSQLPPSDQERHKERSGQYRVRRQPIFRSFFLAVADPIPDQKLDRCTGVVVVDGFQAFPKRFGLF